MLNLKRYIYLGCSSIILLVSLIGFMVIDEMHDKDSLRYQEQAMVKKTLILKNINDTMKMNKILSLDKFNY